MTSPDFDARLHDELRALPAPRAPRSLVPRVLAAIARPEPRPWYARAWLTWPRPIQAVSGVAVLVLALGAALLMFGVIPSDVETASAAGGPTAGRLAAMAHVLDATAALMRVFWRVLLQPVVVYAFISTIVISLMCAAAWSALSRLALGGASQS
jgi:hypothetical protein